MQNSSAVIDLSDGNFSEEDGDSKATPSLVRQPADLTNEEEAEHDGEKGAEQGGATLMDAMRSQMADTVRTVSVVMMVMLMMIMMKGGYDEGDDDDDVDDDDDDDVDDNDDD